MRGRCIDDGNCLECCLLSMRVPHYRLSLIASLAIHYGMCSAENEEVIKYKAKFRCTSLDSCDSRSLGAFDTILHSHDANCKSKHR